MLNFAIVVLVISGYIISRKNLQNKLRSNLFKKLEIKIREGISPYKVTSIEQVNPKSSMPFDRKRIIPFASMMPFLETDFYLKVNCQDKKEGKNFTRWIQAHYVLWMEVFYESC